jgi:hypothetical protein
MEPTHLLAVAFHLRYTVARPTAVNGVPGPLDTKWRVSVYQRKNAGTLQVVSTLQEGEVGEDDAKKLHSMQGIERFYAKYGCEKDSEMPAADHTLYVAQGPCQHESMESDEDTREVLYEVCEETMDVRSPSVSPPLSDCATSLPLLGDTCTTRASVARRSRDQACLDVSTFLDSTLLDSTLQEDADDGTMVALTGATRKAVHEHAFKHKVAQRTTTPGLAACAGAILSRSNHLNYPLLMATMRLPSTTVRVHDNDGKEWVVCEMGGTISAYHSQALRARFQSPAWMHHVQAMPGSRPRVGVYDAYDPLDGTYGGSVVLSKFLAEQRGAYVPIVVVESLVSQVSGTGVGGALFRFATQLLYSEPINGTPPPYGIVAAMCVVHSRFWEYKIADGPIAHSIFLQMHMHYESVGFRVEDGCDYMSDIFFANSV